MSEVICYLREPAIKAVQVTREMIDNFDFPHWLNGSIYTKRTFQDVELLFTFRGRKERQCLLSYWLVLVGGEILMLTDDIFQYQYTNHPPN